MEGHRDIRTFNSHNKFLGPKQLFAKKSMYELNHYEMSGLPPHKITLCVGVPIMLLTNMDVRNGHCNGTRYIVDAVGKDVIIATTLTGPSKGKQFIIPRYTS
jgi:hypothetical protein